MRLGWGKFRRFCYSAFATEYVAHQVNKRQGECNRCGACCKLLYNCPYLDDSVAPCECKFYHRTFANCRLFPLDERDIADRDIVSPDVPCGYRFPKPDRAAKHGDNGRGRKKERGGPPQASART